MKRWLAGLVLAGVLAFAIVAASCRQDVPLGVTPELDAGGADAGSGE
jgi:hypothetical protein